MLGGGFDREFKVGLEIRTQEEFEVVLGLEIGGVSETGSRDEGLTLAASIGRVTSWRYFIVLPSLKVRE